MLHGDRGDIVGGLFLVAVGIFWAVHAAVNYRLGNAMQMGPGMVPTAIGVLLAGLGVMIIVPALFRYRAFPKLDYRSMIAVSVGIGIFALTVRPFGVVPAIFGLTAASAFADGKFRPIEMALLACALSVMAVVIFVYALSLSLTIFHWPF